MKKILSILLSAILAAAALGISASARTLGDVDGNKSANSSDALKILMYSVGTLDTIDKRLADVNCDGNVNSSDALTVLRISVNLYDGPTEVDLKPEIIDPIIKTGKFTLSTIMNMEDTKGNIQSTPTTFMVNGKNICVLTKLEGVDVRFLFLNGKAYLVIPDLIPGLKVYADIPENLLEGLDFSSISFNTDQTYVGSFFSTYNGKTCTVDTYRSEDGSLTDYYFLDGKWAMLNGHSEKPENSRTITDFKAGVNESYFSLKGLKKINIEDLLNKGDK